ncbi:MAG: hypothetical protein KF802_14640 [Bdellovibrionaceae bacterium]|nr:hypothetical protein [Pseudobdellovibrionaceae bacterium]
MDPIIPHDTVYTPDTLGTFETSFSAGLDLIYAGHHFVGFVTVDGQPGDLHASVAMVLTVERSGREIEELQFRRGILRALLDLLFKTYRQEPVVFRTSYEDLVLEPNIGKAMGLLEKRNPHLFS